MRWNALGLIELLEGCACSACSLHWLNCLAVVLPKSTKATKAQCSDDRDDLSSPSFKQCSLSFQKKPASVGKTGVVAYFRFAAKQSSVLDSISNLRLSLAMNFKKNK